MLQKTKLQCTTTYTYVIFHVNNNMWHWWLCNVPQLQIFNGWLGGDELNVQRASSCRLLCGTRAYQDCPYNKCVDVFSFALIVQEVLILHSYLYILFSNI
jgi:hypothetical protein